MKRVLFVVVAACAPSQDPIGETIFAVDADDTGTAGELGRGGHLARSARGGFFELWTPSGTRAWKRNCDSGCSRVAVDADGNVYSASPRAQSSQLLAKFSATDGALLWSREFTALNSTVALDASGNAWMLINSTTAIDFGGGPVGGGPLATLWGRYAPDGTYQASGAVGFLLDTTRVGALPGAGLVASESATFALVAFDDTGILWRVDREVHAFAVHGNGELTITERIEADEAAGETRVELVRLDAQRAERWRRSLRSEVALAAIPGSSVVAAGTDSLAQNLSQDAAFFELFEPDGSSRSEILATYVWFSSGPEADGFRYYDLDARQLVGRRVR
jgi:outer membrane protein assembly factor BamB